MLTIDVQTERHLMPPFIGHPNLGAPKCGGPGSGPGGPAVNPTLVTDQTEVIQGIRIRLQRPPRGFRNSK